MLLKVFLSKLINFKFKLMKSFALALLASTATSIKMRIQSTTDFADYISTFGKSYSSSTEYAFR